MQKIELWKQIQFHYSEDLVYCGIICSKIIEQETQGINIEPIVLHWLPIWVYTGWIALLISVC